MVYEGKITRKKFREWLKGVSYKELLQEYNKVKIKMMLYNKSRMQKTGLYQKDNKMENMKMLKYRNSLIIQELNKRTGYYEAVKRRRKIGNYA